jgi:hypothetical protein
MPTTEIFIRNRRNPDAGHAERQGNVVRQVGQLVEFNPRSSSSSKRCHRRPAHHVMTFASIPNCEWVSSRRPLLAWISVPPSLFRPQPYIQQGSGRIPVGGHVIKRFLDALRKPGCLFLHSLPV